MAAPDPEILVADRLALQVCAAARDGARAMTAYQLGQSVDRHQATVTRPLNTLTKAGALRRGVETRRGKKVTVFWFNDSWGDALRDALQRESLGQLKEGSRLILVASDGVEAAAELLQDDNVLEHVAWISEFDDSRLSLLIALRRDIDPSVLSGIIPALRRLGLPTDGAVRLAVGRTLDRPELVAWTRDILGGRTARQLSTGE